MRIDSDLVVCDRCDRMTVELFPDGEEMICGPCAEEVDGRPACAVCDGRSDVLFPSDEGDVCPECSATAADRAAWRDADIRLDELRDRELYESPDFG